MKRVKSGQTPSLMVCRQKQKKHSGKYKHENEKRMRMIEYVRTLQTQSVERCGPFGCVFLDTIDDEARVNRW